ncbi:MAG: glucose 1-dehydrogenase [Sphaerochaetaceae bacterium]|nr:glucose 1-dehydrogenase [Sphaerochaetaceae bacterium]
MTQLLGKHALVTGASGGIGRACAIELAKSGASVSVHYARNVSGAEKTVAEINEFGGKAQAFKANLTKRKELYKLHHFATQCFGPVDILVNNAGIGAVHSVDTITEISMTDWDAALQVNVTAPALLTRLVIPNMVEHRDGAIINISSIRGMLGNPNLAVYCTSKGALALLTKQLATDYSPYNIRINCICPGFVSTEMFQSYIEKQNDPQEALRVFASMAPLNRVGKPEEIAKAVLFFASDESSFITGVVFPVDGGYTASGTRRIL